MGSVRLKEAQNRQVRDGSNARVYSERNPVEGSTSQNQIPTADYRLEIDNGGGVWRGS
jgi:hypothetical protein